MFYLLSALLVVRLLLMCIFFSCLKAMHLSVVVSCLLTMTGFTPVQGSCGWQELVSWNHIGRYVSGGCCISVAMSIDMIPLLTYRLVAVMATLLNNHCHSNI